MDLSVSLVLVSLLVLLSVGASVKPQDKELEKSSTITETEEALSKLHQKSILMQKIENASQQPDKNKRPPKLLPVPPGTSKHPKKQPPPPRPPPPPARQPSPSPADHLIEIVPQPYVLPRNEHSNGHLDIKHIFPSRSPERHLHVYSPPGNTPGHFTIYPRTPDSGGPKIRYTEPASPPQKTHFHVQLPPQLKPNPPEVHYKVPVPSSDSNHGNEVNFRVPLPESPKNNVRKKVISLLRELVRKKVIFLLKKLIRKKVITLLRELAKRGIVLNSDEQN